jgi:PPOX class probable F420-dependent enzyme
VVPCCFALCEERLFSAVDDVKPKSTVELRRLENLRSNRAASLLVDHYEEAWTELWWVRVDGTGRVVQKGDERDRALELLCSKYEQYRASPPPGDVIVIDIETWRSWP